MTFQLFLIGVLKTSLRGHCFSETFPDPPGRADSAPIVSLCILGLILALTTRGILPNSHSSPPLPHCHQNPYLFMLQCIQAQEMNQGSPKLSWAFCSQPPQFPTSLVASLLSSGQWDMRGRFLRRLLRNRRQKYSPIFSSVFFFSSLNIIVGRTIAANLQPLANKHVDWS